MNIIRAMIIVGISIITSVITTFINNRWHIKQLKLTANIWLGSVISILACIIDFLLVKSIEIILVLPFCMVVTALACYIRCSMKLDNLLR
jgi:MFS-type transporter involved in bile tolerance (Atg22 family)